MLLFLFVPPSGVGVEFCRTLIFLSLLETSGPHSGAHLGCSFIVRAPRICEVVRVCIRVRGLFLVFQCSGRKARYHLGTLHFRDHAHSVFLLRISQLNPWTNFE